MPEYRSDRLAEYLSDRLLQNICQKVCIYIYIYMPDGFQGMCRIECQKRCLNRSQILRRVRCQNICSDICLEMSWCGSLEIHVSTIGPIRCIFNKISRIDEPDNIDRLALSHNFT